MKRLNIDDVLYLDGRNQGSDKRANEQFNHVTAFMNTRYSPHILEKGEVGKVT